MDVFRLNNITIFPRLGVREHEKEAVQKVSMDADLYFDIAKPARSDHIADTIDYQQVYDLILKVSDDRKYHLVEALAHKIAKSILDQFKLSRVTVRVRKLNLPFSAHMSYVEVELTETAGKGK